MRQKGTYLFCQLFIALTINVDGDVRFSVFFMLLSLLNCLIHARTTSGCGARYLSSVINHLDIYRPRHNPPRSLYLPPAAVAARFPLINAAYAAVFRFNQLVRALVHSKTKKTSNQMSFLFWLLKLDSNQRQRG